MKKTYCDFCERPIEECVTGTVDQSNDTTLTLRMNAYLIKVNGKKREAEGALDICRNCIRNSLNGRLSYQDGFTGTGKTSI